MKDVKKEAKLSKMSLAARKAWETRKGEAKPRKSGKERVQVEKQVNEDAEVIVEQLKKAYRKGMLVPKGKRVIIHKNAVKMDGKWMQYLYGKDYLQRVVVQKLSKYASDLWGKLIFEGKELEQPIVMVNAK